jgi:hypothetical protein
MNPTRRSILSAFVLPFLRALIPAFGTYKAIQAAKPKVAAWVTLLEGDGLFLLHLNFPADVVLAPSSDIAVCRINGSIAAEVWQALDALDNDPTRERELPAGSMNVLVKIHPEMISQNNIARGNLISSMVRDAIWEERERKNAA